MKWRRPSTVELALIVSVILLVAQLIPMRTWRGLKPLSVGKTSPEAITLQMPAGDKEVEIEVPYLLYLPKGYRSRGDWPLLISLHGAGQRGPDLRKVEHPGPLRYVQQNEIPCIVAAPLCRENQSWDDMILREFVQNLVDLYKVDPNRVYCTGLSMGGSGVWSLAASFPELFAAAAPICGVPDTSWANRLKETSVWAFQGAHDKPRVVNSNRAMVAAIRNAGGNAMLTEYPDLGHDSWTITYENPELYRWLFSHSKATVPHDSSSGVK